MEKIKKEMGLPEDIKITGVLKEIIKQKIRKQKCS